MTVAMVTHQAPGDTFWDIVRKGAQAAAANAGKANTPKMTVAMVTHQAPGDTFWDIVRKGAQAAAAKDNIDLQYSNDPDQADQSQLIQAAIDKKVDGSP